tara:strand:+ start:54 stop:779 length:726 start_codon:yes stop_codon:yes gene_type:complete
VLLIDDRENPKLIGKLLMRMGDSKHDVKGEAKVCRMKTADYRLGEWGVEAKEINDLYRSIMGIGRSRTIIAQLRDLEKAVENPMLVVYGTQLKPYFGGKSSGRTMAIEIARMRQTIRQFKLTFYLRFPKFQYMEFVTMDDFVEWLIISHTQLNVSAKTKELPLDLRKNIEKSNLDQRVAVLSSIQGISQSDAENLLQKFGSLPKILHSRMTQKSLMQVEGIGRSKAKNILGLREKLITDTV